MGANNSFGLVLSVVIAASSDGKTNEQKDELPVDIKLPVKHVLSRELQVYNLLLVFCIIYFIFFHYLFGLYFFYCSSTSIKSQSLLSESLIQLFLKKH